MPILLDSQWREFMPHNGADFPITYFHDELAALPNWTGPLHWHPDFEIATAASTALDYQVGEHHIRLEAGDSIFVNGNMLHGIRQLAGEAPDAMPNIVFSGTCIAPQASTLYKKYIQPLMQCDSLPFLVFRHDDPSHQEINQRIQDTYQRMGAQKTGYELAVQRNINCILEYIACHFSSLPKVWATRIELDQQIRLQKMMTYVYDHYAEEVTLADIAKAANINRSEAGRCFRKYMGCSPIEVLIQYRLQTAHRLLGEKVLSLQEISFACGFHSVSYFSRQFRARYGCSPSKKRDLGK